MPRTSKPILPEAELIENSQAEIDRLGWQTVRNQIIHSYEERIDKIRQTGLSADEISQKRFKKLSRHELITLALCFLTCIVQLHQQGLDTENTIRQLCENETELLERGYPKATIAKNHHPLYINLIRNAISAEPSRSTIATNQIVLNQQNSWSIPVPDKDTGELSEISIHYVQMYLKYDTPFYVNLKRSTTASNNIKQDHPQPVRLYPYLETINTLLHSNSYTELATAIAAASGRRFTEIVKGSFSIPDTSTHPYEYLFEGQLKKKDKAPAYLPYSIVPASQLLDAIARFRSLPKIQLLLSATSTKINQSINPAVKYQVEKHFQHSDLVRVLKGESGVTIQNLRSVYGEIATHFFCPYRASFHRFLSLRLGHLIGDEAVDSPNSPSTEHYFHYYLVDEKGEQIDSLGVLLDKSNSSTLSAPPEIFMEDASGEHQQQQIKTNDKRTIVQTRISTKKRFNQFRGEDMTENDTLISIMDKADKADRAEELERELMEARAQISSLEAKLNSSVLELSVDRPSIAKDTSSQASDSLKQEQNASHSHDSSNQSEPHPVPQHHTNDAVLMLVKSMSQLTSKLSLFLDHQISAPPSGNSDTNPLPSADPSSPPPNSHDADLSTIETSSDENSPPVSSSSSAEDTEALLNRAIDTIMAHNDRSENKTDKWYIGINPLKDIINSQFTISRVVKQRKPEINAHHKQHHINSAHNSHYHRQQRYTDFFDFD